MVTVQFLAVAMEVSAPAAVAGRLSPPPGAGEPRDCIKAFAAAALSFVSRMPSVCLVVKPLPMPGRVTDSSDEQPRSMCCMVVTLLVSNAGTLVNDEQPENIHCISVTWLVFRFGIVVNDEHP